MSFRTGFALTLAATLAALPQAAAQSASFMYLEDTSSAMDMTPDGKIVVGGHPVKGGYYWTAADGFTFIGGNSAVAVSDDGSVIFGSVYNEDGHSEAAIWTADTGWELLGGLPGGLPCPSISSAYEISADGSVAVGLSWIDGCDGAAFRWTPEDEMVGMETLGNGGNRASVVSADGTLAGGFAQGTGSRTPAIWYADGTGELLDPTGDVGGEVSGISDDGSIILGTWDYDAFYRTEEEGIVIFDTIISGWNNQPLDIDDNGTIVGFDSLMTSRIAWIKPAGENASQLAQYLTAHGADGVPGQLQVAQAISTDGRVIIGHNYPGGGWIAYLGSPADINGDGKVDVLDLLQLLGAWGDCTGDCPEDINGDGTVDVLDLLELLAAWD